MLHTSTYLGQIVRIVCAPLALCLFIGHASAELQPVFINRGLAHELDDSPENQPILAAGSDLRISAPEVQGHPIAY